MTKDDLKPFCSPDPIRETMAESWTAGAFSYATSGHILIRVPRLADVPEGEGINFGKVGESFDREPAAWFPVAPLTVVPVDCP